MRAEILKDDWYLFTGCCKRAAVAAVAAAEVAAVADTEAPEAGGTNVDSR